MDTTVRIEVGSGFIEGNFAIPENPAGVIVFAHGSGSGRRSVRNRLIATSLRDSGFATLLVDLLTYEEEFEDHQTARLRFDIRFLADRLHFATDWLSDERGVAGAPVGYFGASMGAAVALVAAAERRESIFAVVSRGGRPDLAGPALPLVVAPTHLIVGAEDRDVVSLNREAYAQLTAARFKELTLVPGATHVFSEPGTLQEVARLACRWFQQHVPVLSAETCD